MHRISLTRSLRSALVLATLLAGPLATLLAGPLAARASATTPVTISKAQQALDRALAFDIAQAGGTDSALVVDMRTGQTLFSVAPNAPRLPASVEKLYTTATALVKFGADATLTTSVLGVGSLGDAGTWQGTLYLRGGGDPTFGSASFDDLMYGTGVGASTDQLAASLAQLGIRKVSGPVIGDESAFDSLRGTPATGYAADLEVEGELSALAYDDGFTSAAEDALQANPPRYAASELLAALAAAGVKVAHGASAGWGVTPVGATLLAQVSSPPISSLIELTNSPSDNFFAETLLKDIGAHFGTGGSTAAGAAVVRSVMAANFGLHPRLNDGSGLSRYDRTTAAQIVSLLIALHANASFTDSLAIAGVRGTMQDEMLGTRAVDNCRGKTGTLHDVANLVGYCTARNGDPLVFAFLFNSQSDSDYGHAMEDLMGAALADYQ